MIYLIRSEKVVRVSEFADFSSMVQCLKLLSPSDGLASFLETFLANGVKVVETVITSKFRFHLIAIYALGCNFSCTEGQQPLAGPKFFFGASKKLVTGPNGIMVAQKFCDIFL
jgi:hypothetical protein